MSDLTNNDLIHQLERYIEKRQIIQEAEKQSYALWLKDHTISFK